MEVRRLEFIVPENHKYPQVAALAKMAESPAYTDFFYICGILQSLHNLGLIEDCGFISDSLTPLWWNLFYLRKDSFTPEKFRKALDATGWPPEMITRLTRLYEAYLRPDFFDSLRTK
jgi:hypothetical protein